MNVILSLLHKVFGNTQVFTIVLSWFLMITGALMMWKPEGAAKSLAGRGFFIIKGYILALFLFIGALLISVTSKMNGILALIILIAGIVFLFKGFFYFQKTAALKLNNWMAKVPLKYLRIFAAIQLVMGIGIQVIRGRF
jgi:uncharacterized protein YjeT (DUF2065 family)